MAFEHSTPEKEIWDRLEPELRKKALRLLTDVAIRFVISKPGLNLIGVGEKATELAEFVKDSRREVQNERKKMAGK